MASAKPRKLTDKQKRFIDEYLLDGNATAAALRAGYKTINPNNTGCEVMGYPHVKAELARRQAKLSQKLEITAERVLAEYAKIAFSNMADFITPVGKVRNIDLSKLTRDQAAAIQEISVDRPAGGGVKAGKIKIKLVDKKGALDSLGRHLGLFAKDAQQINVHVSLEDLVMGSMKLPADPVVDVPPSAPENPKK